MKIYEPIVDIFHVISDVIKDQWNRFNIDKTTAKFELKPDGVTTKTTLDPNAGATDTAYVLDTTVTHTGGDVFKLKNNGVDFVTVSAGGTLTNSGSISLDEDQYIYFKGDSTTDGSVRMYVPSSGDHAGELVVEFRVSGVWTFSGSFTDPS